MPPRNSRKTKRNLKGRLSLLAVILLIVSLFSSSVYSYAQGDTTPPTLTELTITPQQAEVEENIKIEAEISDDLSGVSYANVNLQLPNNGNTKSVLLTQNKNTGKFEGNFIVGEGEPSGIWKINYVSLWDNQYNYFFIYNSDLKGREGETGKNYEYKNLSIYNITVGTPKDSQSPVTGITIDSLTPKNGNWFTSSVSVSFNASDDLSGVKETLYKINEGSWTLYSSPFKIDEDGVYSIEYKSIDIAGNEEEVKTETVNIDKSGPVTTIKGVPQGWTNQNVTIQLSANDELSGVLKTEFKLNNGEWVNYNTPLIISEEGISVIHYRSTDIAGNVEDVKSLEVKIDKTHPSLNISFDQSEIFAKNHKLVPIIASINSEDDISGVASVELVSIISNQEDNGNGDGNTASDIQDYEIGTLDTYFLVRAERSGSQGDRVYTITYNATDLAGNSTEVSETIIVTHGH